MQPPPRQVCVQLEPTGQLIVHMPPWQSDAQVAPCAHAMVHPPPWHCVVQWLPSAQVDVHALPVSGHASVQVAAIGHVQTADALHDPPGVPPLVPLSPLLPLVPPSPVPPLDPVPSVKSYEQPCTRTAPRSAVSTSKGDERMTKPA
jgi:hypothetical protein